MNVDIKKIKEDLATIMEGVDACASTVVGMMAVVRHLGPDDLLALVSHAAGSNVSAELGGELLITFTRLGTAKLDKALSLLGEAVIVRAREVGVLNNPAGPKAGGGNAN